MRARDLGIRFGLGTPGPLNAITDVAGVTVGHTTLIRGEGPLVVGEGPVRTGVTVVCPRGSGNLREPVFAGCHRLNGNGELTGLEWVRESGMLTSPVAITNTHSVGRRARRARRGVGRTRVLRAWCAAGRRGDVRRSAQRHQRLPRRVRNTCTTRLPRRPMARSRRAPSAAGPAWSATSSRAGSGRRRASSSRRPAASPSACLSRRTTASAIGSGSTACGSARPSRRPRYRVHTSRSDRRAPDHRPARDRSSSWSPPMRRSSPTSANGWPSGLDLGIARVGGTGGHTSGDLFIAFATGNRLPSLLDDESPAGLRTYDVRAVGDIIIDRLFDAVIESTEEAIVNALVARDDRGRTGRHHGTCAATRSSGRDHGRPRQVRVWPTQTANTRDRAAPRESRRRALT